MENTYIWIILKENKVNEKEPYVLLEILEGRNKYTGSGLFTGPLRKCVIDFSCVNKSVRFLLAIPGVIQTGKNTFKISNQGFLKLLAYFKEIEMDALYCKLADKKLHHINKFILTKDLSLNKFEFNTRNGNLIFLSPTEMKENKLDTETESIIEPIVHLYFYQEKKIIRGYLYFLYKDVEVPSNNSDKKIETATSCLLRNYQFEIKVLEHLFLLGGKKSTKNELCFSKESFFSSVLPALNKSNFELYWGESKKSVSKSTISCSISYDIDWFALSGNVLDGEHEYQLSDLLRMSRGRSYIELNNKVFFLPKELQEIANSPQDGNIIKLSAHNLLQINKIADDFNIDTSTYLDKFLNFSSHEYTIDSELSKKLKEYQKDGLRWILTLSKNGFGGCLADDMGLGKTVQAISFICNYERRQNSPTLIIVPKIVLYNWKSEFVKFAPKEEVTLAYGDFPFANLTNSKIDSIYLTTYDTLLNKRDHFNALTFGVIILDEAQYVKNYRTKRYQAIKGLKRSFVLALTGTPIENNIEELWSIFNLLNPGLLGNHSVFMKEYGDIHENFTKMNRLKKAISPFFLRRTKEAVLKELPPKTESYVYCEMEAEQRALYQKILTAAQNEIHAKPSRFIIKDNAAILQALLYLREVCSDPQLLPANLRSGLSIASCKFKLFQDYTQKIVNESGKVIIFSQFPRVLKKMENWCLNNKWKTYYIDGKTNNREKIIQEFEQTAEGVFLISLKAGGVGLNLVSCQYVLIYEPWWNSAVEQQAANRVYRIGQNKPVFIYHFLIRNTIEEKIHDLQIKKLALSLEMMEGMNQHTKISMNEICQILF